MKFRLIVTIFFFSVVIGSFLKVNMISSLKPSQIVRSSSQNYQFYGEVIAVLPARESCWVRPLILLEKKRSFVNNWIDLRQASDLIFPMRYFEPALDTEIMPLFTLLVKGDSESHSFVANHPQLTLFLKELLINNPKTKDVTTKTTT